MASDRKHGPVERGLEVAGLALSVAWLAVVLWQYVDPEADPKERLAEAWAWAEELFQRRSRMLEQLREIRDLPESED